MPGSCVFLRREFGQLIFSFSFSFWPTNRFAPNFLALSFLFSSRFLGGSRAPALPFCALSRSRADPCVAARSSTQGVHTLSSLPQRPSRCRIAPRTSNSARLVRQNTTRKKGDADLCESKKDTFPPLSPGLAPSSWSPGGFRRSFCRFASPASAWPRL